MCSPRPGALAANVAGVMANCAGCARKARSPGNGMFTLLEHLHRQHLWIIDDLRRAEDHGERYALLFETGRSLGHREIGRHGVAHVHERFGDITVLLSFFERRDSWVVIAFNPQCLAHPAEVVDRRWNRDAPTIDEAERSEAGHEAGVT